jgi:hypothetical protein
MVIVQVINLKALISSFPRHVATPNRVTVKTETQFYEYVNKYNGVKDLYFSVYGTTEQGKFENVMIDKIFFDFDEKDAIEDVKRFHNWLKEKDIQHTFLYSGKKGFHLYVFTINYEKLEKPKDALTNAHDFFIKNLGVKCDQHIVGDIARVSRIPNSFHISGRRYCIPLLREHLYRGIKYIKEKAKEQQFNFVIYGSKLFDMKQFDFVVKNNFKSIDIPEYKYNIKTEDVVIRKFLPCVQSWLVESESGTWEARYNFAVYCKALCLPKSLCNKLAEKYFSEMPRTDRFRNNYTHFRAVKALEYAYDKDTAFPNCDTLFQKGLCKGKCKFYNKTGLYK